MLIGAGVGAIGSAATGKSPFKGALLGAALGGIGGQLSGATAGFGEAFGTGSGGLLSGFKGVEAAAPSFAGGGYAGAANTVAANAVAPAALATAPVSAPAGFVGSNGEIVPNLLSEAPYTGGVDSLSNINSYGSSMASPYTPEVVYNSQFAGAVNPNFKPIAGQSADYTGGGYNPSLMGRMKDAVPSIIKDNPMASASLAMTGYDKATEQPPETPVLPAPPIQKQQFDPSSILSAVSPVMLATKGNEIGLPTGLLSKMPMTDEERYRLQQMAQRAIA